MHGENVPGIELVVVDGRIVMSNGKLTCIDEDKITAELQDVHAELKDQIMGSEGSAKAVFEGIRKVYEKALNVSIGQDVTKALLEDHAQNAGNP